MVKNLPQYRRLGFNHWVGNIPWRRAWHPLNYSFVENSMDRRSLWATVHGVAKSWMTEWLYIAHKETESEYPLTLIIKYIFKSNSKTIQSETNYLALNWLTWSGGQREEQGRNKGRRGVGWGRQGGEAGRCSGGTGQAALWWLVADSEIDDREGKAVGSEVEGVSSSHLGPVRSRMSDDTGRKVTLLLHS